jgi:hypothetical protein
MIRYESKSKIGRPVEMYCYRRRGPRLIGGHGEEVGIRE